MLKQEIRKLFKSKRTALSASEKMKLDDLLFIQFQNLALGDIHAMMSYWPLERHGEMNTLLFTHYLEHAIPALQVSFPVITMETGEMSAILVHEETDFVENAFGIPEPEEGEEIDPVELDLVFVPLLAFDRHGYRVGYGKGFYDRFLQKCRNEVINVGFSYFDPIDIIYDKNQFDVPLKFCITPQKIYEF